MKKLSLFVAIVLTLVFALNVAPGNTAPRKKEPTRKSAQAAKPSAEEICRAYAIMDANSGKILDSKNADAKLPPASITKLMVAYIVTEKLAKKEIQLTDKITVSRDASRIGGSQVYLQEGEAFTLEELMKAMMIHSANDAAYAIAEHIAGSREAFVKLMNEKAASLKMTNTEFHSPHGLPPSKGDKEDLISCNDLLILSRELLRYPKLLEWTSTVKDTFRDGKFGLQNTNKLLTRMPGVVDGLKTGFYSQAGFSISASAKKGDLRFIVAVMGCPSGKIRDNFAATKLKEFIARYKTIQVVKKGEVIDKDLLLRDGKYPKVKGVAGEGFSLTILQGRKGEIRREVVAPEVIKGEIREGQKLGELVIYLDKEKVGKVDIVSPAFIPKANLFTRLIRMLGLNI